MNPALEVRDMKVRDYFFPDTNGMWKTDRAAWSSVTPLPAVLLWGSISLVAIGFTIGSLLYFGMYLAKLAFG